MISERKESKMSELNEVFGGEPTYNKIILEIEKTKERSQGGIIIPNMSKEKPITARVIAAGPGRYENGTLIPTCVKVGDRVVFTKLVGMPFKCNGKEYIAIPDADIVMKIPEGVEIEYAPFNT